MFIFFHIEIELQNWGANVFKVTTQKQFSKNIKIIVPTYVTLCSLFSTSAFLFHIFLKFLFLIFCSSIAPQCSSCSISKEIFKIRNQRNILFFAWASFPTRHARAKALYAPQPILKIVSNELSTFTYATIEFLDKKKYFWGR